MPLRLSCAVAHARRLRWRPGERSGHFWRLRRYRGGSDTGGWLVTPSVQQLALRGREWRGWGGPGSPRVVVARVGALRVLVVLVVGATQLRACFEDCQAFLQRAEVGGFVDGWLSEVFGVLFHLLYRRRDFLPFMGFVG